MTEIANSCYKVKQIREIERLAIQDLSISENDLMARAGAAAFEALLSKFPDAKKIAVVCGSGNNGGDGYIVARLARKNNFAVTVYHLGELKALPPSAANALHLCQEMSVEVKPLTGVESLKEYDLVVDAILGIGLHGKVRGEALTAINLINETALKVLAIDTPSGLDVDAGCKLGVAVKADLTITFIAIKQGLLTGEALNYSGELILDDLELDKSIYKKISATAKSFDFSSEKSILKPRLPNSHKGNFGHVLVVGGDYGMAGAVRMAAEAAARVGAGLVTVATRAEHICTVTANRPELMCFAVGGAADLKDLLKRATTVIIGPGLGTSSWAKELFSEVLTSSLPLIVDASALQLLADEPHERDNWILTPHPGEAATLLGTDSQSIQANRFTAASDLVNKYGGIIVLKGAGTIVSTAEGIPGICAQGNPGMSSGGMGDILSGVLAGLLAQGIPLINAGQLGVAIHAKAGDLAAKTGERGLLASDLLKWLRSLVN